MARLDAHRPDAGFSNHSTFWPLPSNASGFFKGFARSLLISVIRACGLIIIVSISPARLFLLATDNFLSRRASGLRVRVNHYSSYHSI
ncbi:hypothetical protein BDN70DRAFT_874763 [Pholiota conissans]|uniref:Uncharacterized protein n=1 Tax=Pholiota conissans TaxID=109636 RepID=A0A9P5Z8F8_9AGAR|nr:hypothetical protein BDN70DRAFT_874763 [Pholiota conissans]